jgi:hypothetical protein
MYYDLYSDPERVDIFQMKRLPQFTGMTESEIKDLLHKIHRIEQRQWEEEQAQKLSRERAADRAYLENNEDRNLPNGSVKIQQGIIITPSLVDDHGFAAREDLSNQKGTMKMSLDEKKKSTSK